MTPQTKGAGKEMTSKVAIRKKIEEMVKDEAVDEILALIDTLITKIRRQDLEEVKEFYVGTISYGTPDYLIGREEFIQQMCAYLDSKIEKLEGGEL